jgi:cysteine-rich repeat protein
MRVPPRALAPVPGFAAPALCACVVAVALVGGGCGGGRGRGGTGGGLPDAGVGRDADTEPDAEEVGPGDGGRRDLSLPDSGERCGDGVVQPGEDCDVPGGSAECNGNCTFPACGDGIVNRFAGEECDDAYAGGGDGCSGACLVEPGYSCAGEPSVCTRSGGAVYDGVASPYVSIPDSNPSGVRSTVDLSAPGCTVASVEVYVEVRHPYIGDLRVALTGPTGVSVRLHDRSGGAADDLVATYPTEVAAAQSLAAFGGTSARGTWVLEVSDNAPGDVGTLDVWTLTVTCR